MPFFSEMTLPTWLIIAAAQSEATCVHPPVGVTWVCLLKAEHPRLHPVRLRGLRDAVLSLTGAGSPGACFHRSGLAGFPISQPVASVSHCRKCTACFSPGVSTLPGPTGKKACQVVVRTDGWERGHKHKHRRQQVLSFYFPPYLRSSY